MKTNAQLMEELLDLMERVKEQDRHAPVPQELLDREKRIREEAKQLMNATQ